LAIRKSVSEHALSLPVGRDTGSSPLQAHVDRLLAISRRMQGDFAESFSAIESVVDERNWLRALIDRVPDLLFVKDTLSRILVANEATAAGKTFIATGEPVTVTSLIGKTDFDFFPREVAQQFRDVEVQIMQSGRPMIDMLELNVDGTGQSKWISMTKVPLRNANNEIIGLLGVGRDVTARKQAEDRVQFLAHHDPLTGLPNRALFADRLGQAILRAKGKGRRIAVIFVDVDRFKQVNDRLGHMAGDSLLKITADRMVSCLRSTDTVARLGGDEFVILLGDPPLGNKGLAPIAEMIRSSIAAPAEISGRQFTVTASMGIASFPGDGLTPDELLASADVAMYRAKELGGDHFQFHSAIMTAAATERFSFAEDLRHALAAHEFVLYYQPQIDLKTGQICSVEALIRWLHPVLGLVPPGKFISLAEEIGLIVPIGKWVIETACEQNAQWQQDGLPPITVSVNVSARQFWNKELVGHVRGALEKSGLAAKYLDLELTESMIMQDLLQAIATMHELKAIGVRLSIDDFGTGYSSLSALKSFPIACLKIDQSFIKALSNDEDDRAIVTAVISLGQKLKLRVIAEGVETDEQLAFLQENGCDEAQGFHFSRAVLPNDLANLLKAEHGQPP
jgi:diguanylate cyclase (GGDEF)-like protein/PAS domain S-box-containing protein